MAKQEDKIRSTTSNAPRPENSLGSKSQTSPNGVGVSSWSPKSSSKAKQNHDQNEHAPHHHKKSVFMKVKEKARKLKKSLSGRKRRNENDTQSPYITPPGSTGSLDDDDKDRSEYFGTPLYEPQIAPKKPDSNVDSKQSGLAISTREETKTTKPENGVEENDNVRSMQDKGVSMKEYIMNKFEPGEDERALSQAITQTISPKCEKVKEVVNSLLGTEEASESKSKSSNVAFDVTPSGSSTESNDKKLTSLTNDSNLSNTLEPNMGSSSHASSILKPNSG